MKFKSKWNSALMVFMLVMTWMGCSSDSPSEGETQQPPAFEVTPFNPVTVSKQNSTKIYMHYMPWFETKESSGNNQWGYHWTMANRNPDNIDSNGRRDIASHYYPLIGPYHSGDPDVIENHLLMMKYAGIDGVLIDWYGVHNVNDYPMIKENTEQLIALLDKVGLEFAMVYEDRFLNVIVDQGMAISAIGAAKIDMQYLQSQCFNHSQYTNVNGKPLLLNFGPITLTDPADWTNVFSVLNEQPTFLTLWNQSYQAGSNASGEYTWVYENNNNLQNYYNTVSGLDVVMGSAYPGFHDFYQEGGAGTVIGWTIDHNNGATLAETLEMASTANLDFLQLVTWNDFGEGTMIEPTVEFGYSYLEQIKSFAEVQNLPSVFDRISDLFTLRKAHATNNEIQQKLDQVFYYMVSLQTNEAIQLLNSIDN
ncbi:glycoside hydrolase family 71/99-like protein [Mangrovimonas sp. ST2L15]|uniref:glycoside hydrolase family 71/99-like protein n=1 Tax=Mangrovimonas sp. ST2L15 TaxID=1645916 RepID=UPI0006B63E05|nr:glycoside hydrolase family 71/99-like protein [Mangrovimonas sp. ST2L15]